MTTFVYRTRARFAECDVNARAFTQQYLVWADIAHTELWRQQIGSIPQFNAEGLDFVAAEAKLEVHQPAMYDDELEVVVEVEAMSASSLSSRFRVLRGDEELAIGTLRHVCVDAIEHQKAPWPDYVRDRLAPADPPSSRRA